VVKFIFWTTLYVLYVFTGKGDLLKNIWRQ